MKIISSRENIIKIDKFLKIEKEKIKKRIKHKKEYGGKKPSSWNKEILCYVFILMVFLNILLILQCFLISFTNKDILAQF